MQTTNEARENRRCGIKRVLFRCCFLLALGAVAFSVALFFLWGAYDLQIWGKGMLHADLTWASYVPEVGVNCAAYISWSFVLLWLFNDFGKIYLSGIPGNRRVYIFAIHLLSAFLFTLQMFLTESVADAIARMSWLEFLANHICGCIYLLLIPLSLVISGSREKRMIMYAFAACVSYALSIAVASLVSMSLAKYRLLMVGFMLACFILFAIDEMRFPQKWQRRLEPNVSRSRKIKHGILYFIICGVYILSIIFNLRVGRSAVPSLEDNFFMSRAPFSLTELRTHSLSERDLMRGRMRKLLMYIDVGISSFVDAAVEIMKDPGLYGADYTVTNVLAALARDETGKIHRGIDALKRLETPDLGNREFAKRLNVQGKLSEITLSQKVVDEVTESAGKRLLDVDEEPLNFFLVYTRDKRGILCRVGRDIFNVIRVADKSNVSICDGQVCYGDADLAIADILTFASINDPEAVFNEVLSSCVVVETAQRLGMLRNLAIPEGNSLKNMLEVQGQKDFVRWNAQHILNEDEVRKIREDFANIVGTKRALTPSLKDSLLKLYFRFYDPKYPVASIMTCLLIFFGCGWALGCFRSLIAEKVQRKKKRHGMLFTMFLVLMIVLILPIGILGPEKYFDLFRSLYRRLKGKFHVFQLSGKRQ